jgi:putative ABC transport system permease protein
VFNTQAARTINSGKEDNIRYLAGADIVLQEAWEDNQGSAGGGSGPPGAQPAAETEIIYYEPDFGKYEGLLNNGVQSVTKVLWNSDITMSVSGGTLKNILLMGIHTREFGETAWFSDSLLPYHWYEYLNRMSMDARAVLVSRNFQTQYNYKLGDALYYKNKNNKTARGVIYGFVDYWPSYAPVKYSRGSDGLYKETEQFLIVAHLQ